MACSFLASPVASSACPPPALDGSPCSEERALPSLLGCRRSASSLGRVGISGNYSPAGCRNASSLRSDHPRRRWSSGKTPKGKRNDVKAPPRMVAGPFLAIAGPTTGARRDGRPEDRHLEILEAAREKFAEEVSFRSEDKNISIAKALLYIAAEDEAFVAHNRDRDARSVLREMSGDAPETLDAERGRADLESFPLAGKSISGWLHELDTIAKEVEEELASRDASGRRLEALEAVNTVLFERRCFTRSPAGADSEASYLHTALSSGRCSAIMLSCIYKEICRRLGIATQGRPSGEEGFLIWPRTHSAEEELSAMSADRGRFVVVNGRCVRHPGSGDSDQNRESLLGLDAATNRDVIGIALADLIRLHWKRASGTNLGTMLASLMGSAPSRRGRPSDDGRDPAGPLLLRPQELRLAVMASERLLAVQPRDWTLRRDHGMLLCHSRRYGDAVRELSICLAFAPEEEAAALQPAVERLHLMRREASPAWWTHGNPLSGGDASHVAP